MAPSKNQHIGFASDIIQADYSARVKIIHKTGNLVQIAKEFGCNPKFADGEKTLSQLPPTLNYAIIQRRKLKIKAKSAIFLSFLPGFGSEQSLPTAAKKLSKAQNPAKSRSFLTNRALVGSETPHGGQPAVISDMENQ